MPIQKCFIKHIQVALVECSMKQLNKLKKEWKGTLNVSSRHKVLLARSDNVSAAGGCKI